MDESSGTLSSYWWEESKDNLHRILLSIQRHLDQNQSHHEQNNLRAMRLYSNLNVLGLSAYTYSQNSVVTAPYDRVTLNIVKSMCDTVTNKIAKNKIKPTFLTMGGDYLLQKKAKLLEKFVGGIFYEEKIYEKTPTVFRDATVFGTGALQIYRQGAKICADRVFINELTFDDADAIYGNPRSLYRRKFIPREVLVKRFPKYKEQIMHAKKAENFTPSNPNLSNNILVLEAWHLPSETYEDDKPADDGKHVIVIEGATLVSEKYDKPYFPFAIIRWSPGLLGTFGAGLAQELTGLQIEINKILRTIQLSFHLVGVPSYLVESSSKIIKGHLNNEVGHITTYQGIKPEVYTPNPVAPQLFEHLANLYARAYEIAGVSQLAAQSKKPEGLNSGKALREFNDIESERFILIGQAWEQFHLDIARQCIGLAKDIYAEEKSYTVNVKGKKFLEQIDWDDIDLEDDEYIMQVFPTSFLSSTPSGRLSDIQELAQIGEFDKRMLMRLLDFPDLESFTSLATASIEDMEDMVEKIVDKGEYQAPEPYQDLNFGIQLMQSAYLKYRNQENVPEENLEMLRRWISEAQGKIDEAQAKAAAAAQAAQPQPGQGGPQPGIQGGSPQAVPQAPPTSQLLPNLPGA